MSRFTIRELVLFTIIVAIGLMWWLDRTRLKAKYELALDRIADIEWTARQSRTPVGALYVPR